MQFQVAQVGDEDVGGAQEGVAAELLGGEEILFRVVEVGEQSADLALTFGCHDGDVHAEGGDGQVHMAGDDAVEEAHDGLDFLGAVDLGNVNDAVGVIVFQSVVDTTQDVVVAEALAVVVREEGNGESGVIVEQAT